MKPSADLPRKTEDEPAVEIELAAPLTEAVIQPIRELAHKVFVDSRGAGRDRLEHTFSFVVSTDKVMEGALRNFARDSFVELAKVDQKLAGFVVIVITPENKVIDSFVGVDWPFVRQGIATRLMRAAHEQLRRRGIKEYPADVWEGSRKIFEKEQTAGRLTFRDDPENPKRIWVQL